MGVQGTWESQNNPPTQTEIKTTTLEEKLGKDLEMNSKSSDATVKAKTDGLPHGDSK